MTAGSTGAEMDLPRATMGVLIIVTLIGLTIWVLRPFLGATIWATMIVIATWPVMRQVQRWLWGSRTLATAAMVIAMLLLLLLPLSLAATTIALNAGALVEHATPRAFTFPPPPAWLANVPVVGQRAVEAWRRLASRELADFAASAAPYAAATIVWVAGALRGAMSLLIQFLLTVIIAAVMYAKGERAAEGVRRFGRRLAGEAGDRVVQLAAQAIRSVALGVVVTAIVQAALAGIGLAVAGVPYAVLLGATTFVLCIAQLGPFLVMAPAVGWLVWQGAGTTATLLLIWSVAIGVLDNVLRPILMTRSGNLPMLLMFTGVIGGLLAFGLIGIFVGPVVLAISYTLLAAWSEAPAPAERLAPESTTVAGSD